MKEKEISPHKKLLAWQKAFNLAKKVYQITEKFPKEEMFTLTQQIRRSSVSVVSNIAEGASRVSGREKIQFFVTSRGSLVELETQLLLAKELGYFNDTEIFDEIQYIGKLLNCLIQNRRKILQKILLFFTITYLLTPTYYIFSAFQNTDWSVRAESMGGVFTAISNEPSGVYYNPAGISDVPENYVQVMYSKPYLGLEDVNFLLTSLSVVAPIKYASFGFSFSMYDVQDGLYTETAGIVSAATSLKRVYEPMPDFKIGLNVKYLMKKYKYDTEILNVEPTLAGKDSKSVISADVGLIYKIFSDRLYFGVSVKDINQPNIAVLEGNTDIIPMTISFGSAYNFGDVKAGLYFEDLTVGLELRQRNQDWGEKYFYAIGCETYLNFHTIALRFGVNKNSLNFGFGYYGIKIAERINIGICYSFGISAVIVDNIGNHRAAIEVKF
ncbi:MAG: four helix bundle protein [Endomicrobia bacterium]|nr:four helix bundle protein [Endomicrobiia bacterium]MDW8056448.1 four helix bundle protein [Elusimicrobiota bacterium]